MRHVSEDQGKLIAAQARHRVAAAHAGDEPFRSRLQQRIADFMAQGVIHDFEAIEV